MKLLYVGDSPTLETGFARVGKNLLRRWKPHFERIDIWGIGYSGYPGLPGRVTEWNQPPFVLYPAAYDANDRWYTVDRFQALLNHIMDADYTHLFIVQDHFLLAQHSMAEGIRLACEKKNVKSVYYCPVDAPMEPHWARIVECVDVPVAYTNYGLAELRRHVGYLPCRGEVPFRPEIHVIPHGVDTMTYKPLSDRAAARDRLLKGWLKDSDVLMINVNTNQRRKDVTRSLQILKGLHDAGHKHVKLLMHMNNVSPDHIDLEVVGRQLNLKLGRDWQHTGEYFEGVYATLHEEDLNGLYNAADIYLTTTLGEGWGLGIIEAMAAGCHVVAPANTACEEVLHTVLESGMANFDLLPPEKHPSVLPIDNSRFRYRVDVDKAVGIIAARLPKLPALGEKRPGLNEAVRHWLNWDRIADRFLKLLRRASKRRHYYLEYGGGLGDVFHGMFTRGSANVLRDLAPDETATVTLACHNPYAAELFQHHPKADQFTVLQLPYWLPESDEEKRAEYSLPRPGALARLPDHSKEAVEFYPSPADYNVFSELRAAKYVVFSASAGEPDRNFTPEIITSILAELAVFGIPVAVVGRNYERNDRSEVPVNFTDPLVHNFIDRLSASGVAALVKNSAGLVTCHSALSLLGWHLRKPMLLLYSDRSFAEHVGPRTQWAFGIDNGITVAANIKGYTPRLVARFVDLVR